jgi:hypothetical protein
MHRTQSHPHPWKRQMVWETWRPWITWQLPQGFSGDINLTLVGEGQTTVSTIRQNGINYSYMCKSSRHTMFSWQLLANTTELLIYLITI